LENLVVSALFKTSLHLGKEPALSALPEAILPFAALLHSARAMQAYVGLTYGTPTVFDPVVSISVLAATAVLAAGLAVYLFDWDRVNRTRRGHPLMALLVMTPGIVGLLLGDYRAQRNPTLWRV
jgi:ABC-2 type transport system permease protein